ncbi:hypothetical protein GCM10011490_06880 [Pseudoclavibacter endophyticus]|uniref:Tyrosine-type recombinase/integrase n=1 Tax=Pseudoclavibacter endophyticus TaxID=1778590 RepID=A0A6H9WT14_9MICO|nr:tyrosine-type recombinase/integrase [Pseudoclavibacter endophyticus]KAB1649825.1 tyrosine-type recombinase/integrase [Pseudoclavibacter endophyticus]GGA59473.1 hypothetical protein GCM10011490_06880 [Pseudoclavibacter endophyticus]
MAGKVRREHNGTIRKLPSGRYQLRFKVPGSLPPVYYPAPHTFATKAPAQAALRRHNAAIDAGTWRHPDDLKAEAEATAERAAVEAVTVAELSEQWLEVKRAEGLAHGSLVTYRSRLAASVLPAFGTVRVVDVTPEAVADWFKVRDAESRHVAALAYDTLAAVMRYAVGRGVITESPCTVPSKQRASKRSTGERGIVVPDDIMQAIAAELPAPLHLVPLLAGWAGLREGEALGLTADALSEHDGTTFLHITQQATAKGPSGLAPTKSRAGERVVPVPGWLAPQLHEAVEGGLLFPSPRDSSRPISRSVWDRRFAAAVEAARAKGVPVPAGVRLHDFRHSALTRFARAGATAEDMRRFGGHSDDKTAGVYQHSDAARLADIMRRSES